MGKAAKEKRPAFIQYNSKVILTYTFLSAAVVILGALTKNTTTLLFFSVYMSSWSDPLMYMRLFTHVLGHIDFEHFFSNFIIILLIGPMIEEKYGSKRLLLLIAVTAAVTGLINILFFNTALLGASGVVFMLILLSSYANFQKGRIPLTLILVVVVFIGREVLMGFTADDNISYLTHVIGGALGGVFGYLISGGDAKEGGEPLSPA